MDLPCENCAKGYVLSGSPRGSFVGPAYVHPAAVPSKRAVILLTDIFGLKLVNSKLLADLYSEKLKCDVHVPDIFEGRPPFKEADMTPLLHDVAGTPISFITKLKFIWIIVKGLPGLISNRSTVVDNRITTYVKRIREEKKYEKIGVVGFCFGGAQVIRLASADLFDSAIVAHPGPTTKAQIEAMTIPTSWICAEEDQTFGAQRRLEAEAIFRRKYEIDKLDYEFRDYKGTVHGFGARPNLEIPEIKKAWEDSVEQTVTWFEKTLA